MIRSSLPIDNIQLQGPGFVDIKLLWKELETKYNFQLPYQSTFKFFTSSTIVYISLTVCQQTIYFFSLTHQIHTKYVFRRTNLVLLTLQLE